MRVRAEIVGMDEFLVVMRTTITMPMAEGMSMVQYVAENHDMLTDMAMSKFCVQMRQ